jgi:sugar-specific transcriptional regulator TrmB
MTEPKLLTEAEWVDRMTVPYNRIEDVLSELRERGLIAPEPVDPLLIEAREICSAAYRAASYTAYAEEMARGEHDYFASVQSTLAALKRGMELGRAASPLTREMVREAWCAANSMHKSALVHEDLIDRLHAALIKQMQP